RRLRGARRVRSLRTQHLGIEEQERLPRRHDHAAETPGPAAEERRRQGVDGFRRRPERLDAIDQDAESPAQGPGRKDEDEGRLRRGVEPPAEEPRQAPHRDVFALSEQPAEGSPVRRRELEALDPLDALGAVEVQSEVLAPEPAAGDPRRRRRGDARRADAHAGRASRATRRTTASRAASSYGLTRYSVAPSSNARRRCFSPAREVRITIGTAAKAGRPRNVAVSS